MIALALTLFLAAGFLFVRRWSVTRILSLKEGQSVYYAAVLPAVALFFLSANLYGWLEGLAYIRPAIDHLANVVRDGFAVDANGEVRSVLMGVVAILLGLVVAEVFNAPIDLNSKLTRYLYEEFGESEPLDLVLSEAAESELPVLVTMSTGKFYVGYSLVSEPYGVSGSQWLHLAPWLSGYRDLQSKLEFTTAYAPVAWRSAGERLVHDEKFQIALPLSSVVSINPFDVEIYSKEFSGDETSRLDESEVDPSSAIGEPDWRQAAKRDARLYFLGITLLVLPQSVLDLPLGISFATTLAGGTFLLIVACARNGSA